MDHPRVCSKLEFARRPARDGDMERLFEINEAAMRSHVEANWRRAWDERFQRAMFWEGTNLGTHEVFYTDQQLFGFWSVVRSESEILLERISLMPAFQRRGIGTALIRELLLEGESRGLVVRLQVFPANPARRLYERLGFRHTGGTETHDHMEWRASVP